MPDLAGIQELPTDLPPSPDAKQPSLAEFSAVEPPPAFGPDTRLISTSLPVVEVHGLDWQAVRSTASSPAIRARMHAVVQLMEALFDQAGGLGMLFDADRLHACDRAIKVSAVLGNSPLWIIGDLHGDLLAHEAALAQICDHAASGETKAPIVFPGDFFDDEGYSPEVLLCVFELIIEASERVCIVCGNHDEALTYGDVRFASSVSPSDFADFLNAHLAHEWIERAGKLAVRLISQVPRALFFPDGLLVAHSGFPLAELHPGLPNLVTGMIRPACLILCGRGRIRKRAKRCRTAFRAAVSLATKILPVFAQSSASLGGRSRTWCAATIILRSGMPFFLPTRCIQC